MEEEEEAVEGAVEGRAVREEDENLTPQVVEVSGGGRQPRGEAHILIEVSRYRGVTHCQADRSSGRGWRKMAAAGTRISRPKSPAIAAKVMSSEYPPCCKAVNRPWRLARRSAARSCTQPPSPPAAYSKCRMEGAGSRFGWFEVVESPSCTRPTRTSCARWWRSPPTAAADPTERDGERWRHEMMTRSQMMTL